MNKDKTTIRQLSTVLIDTNDTIKLMYITMLTYYCPPQNIIRTGSSRRHGGGR